MVKGKFLQVVCPRCKSHNIIYGKASSLVKCVKCNKAIARNRGGKARILARIKQILWN
ncbi:MAG: 30S ribosomal protein S27e [archaeon]